MYTEKFLKLPFQTYDPKSADILGSEMSEVETIIQFKKIDVTQIESYAEAIPAYLTFNESNIVATEVTMKSGDVFLVKLTMKEFEEKLNEHTD